MLPPLSTHLGRHKSFSDLNQTRPVLISNPCRVVLRINEGKRGKCSEGNVTLLGPSPIVLSPSHYWSWVWPALASSICLEVPVFQHPCRACVLTDSRYFKPTYLHSCNPNFLILFFINKGLSSFTCTSIHLFYRQ